MSSESSSKAPATTNAPGPANRTVAPQPVPGSSPQFPIFLNIPPPLKSADGSGDNIVVGNNFSSISSNSSAALGNTSAALSNTTNTTSGGIKLNHQLFITDCSEGCMPAYVLSSMVGLMVIGAIFAIVVTLRNRKRNPNRSSDEIAFNRRSNDEDDERHYVTEKDKKKTLNPIMTTTKNYQYRSSSMADISSPNGLRRRSELGPPMMSELNKPFVFKHESSLVAAGVGAGLGVVVGAGLIGAVPPKRPSPAPELVIPRSSEELYAAYTGGFAPEDSPPRQVPKPILVSPQPTRSLKNFTIDTTCEFSSVGKPQIGSAARSDFTTTLIPDTSTTPVEREYGSNQLPDMMIPPSPPYNKSHDADSDHELVDCWNPSELSTDDEEDEDDVENVFFMPKALKVDEHLLEQAQVQQVVESSGKEEA